MKKRMWALWSTQLDGKRDVIALYDTVEYSYDDVKYIAAERQGAVGEEHDFSHNINLREVEF